MWKYLRQLWSNQESLGAINWFCVKVSMLFFVVFIGIVVSVKIVPELGTKTFFLILVEVVFFGYYIFAAPVIIIGLRMLVILSYPKKTKQSAFSRFSDEEKEIRLKIETEKNNEKKQELEQQAFALRQEYESLLSENLLRRDGSFVTDWREVLLVSRKRLMNEEQRLLARNRVHLRIGIFMSLVAVSFLILYMLFRSQFGVNDGFGVFFSNPVPVFSIVAIIQSFSFFFLRLYIIGERELDRNKNEITNIELRLTAGLMMASASDNPDLTSLADALSKEQRNLVLDETESSAVLDSRKFIETLLKLASKGGG